MGINRCVILLSLLCLLFAFFVCVKAGRVSGGSRRTGGGTTRRQPSSNTGHVTKPSYNTGNSATNYNNDLTKLSYANNNAQPGHAIGSISGQNSPPNIGWNVPKQQGPPPAYSASNPIGGSKTNVYEQPPAYKPNNAPPPSYGNNVHTPITATNSHGVQSSYPQQHGGANYYPAGQVPAGATYYQGGHVPAGASYYPAGHVPAGSNYYPAGGHMPAGATYYPSNAGIPQGASYLPAGAALPAGATYYSSPPQSSSSGLGFGSGLAAGAIGGAILGHALTPQTHVVQQAPAVGSSSGLDDKVIIINNGPPGSVTTQTANGATVITTGNQQPAQQPSDTNALPAAAVGAGAAAAAVPLAPLAASPTNENATMDGTSSTAVPAVAPEQPPPGGIICVPVKVNETDPNDATKMIEVEKIACFPAPQPPPQDPATQPGSVGTDGNANVPLAPMSPVPAQASQQLQQNPSTQSASMPVENNANKIFDAKFGLMMISSMFALILSYSFN